MHIAFVNLIIEHYSPTNGGAISTWIMQQTKRLEARGHCVSVLTRVGDSETYDIGQVIPLDIRERHQIAKPRRAWSRLLQNLHRWDWPYYDFYKRSLASELCELQPDAVVCFNDLRTPRVVREALPDKRIWVRLSNEVWTRQPDPAAFDRDLDGYFPVSRYIRDWAVDQYRIDPQRCVVIHNGCDPDTFYPAALDERRDPNMPLRVLFVGRIVHDKGPDLVVEAVKQLREQGRAIQLTVAGSIWWNNDPAAAADPYFAKLTADMKAASVRHLGHVVRGEMPELYRQHDVVVIASRWQEPCAQVQLEAMASGCAVIATNRGGIPEVIDDAGLLFEPDEPNALRCALEQLLEHPEQLQKLKINARRAALNRTWDSVTDHVEAALTDSSIPQPSATPQQRSLSQRSTRPATEQAR